MSHSPLLRMALLCVVGFACTSGAGAQAAAFPHILAKDLTGTAVDLPRDLPGERTLVLVAFEREQQDNLDTWVRGLHLDRHDLAWIETPVIQDPGAAVRWIIQRGMRRSIKKQEVWKHVVTLYTGKADVLRSLGITSEKQVQVLVVERATGRIVDRAVGDFNAADADRLRASLLQGPPGR